GGAAATLQSTAEWFTSPAGRAARSDGVRLDPAPAVQGRHHWFPGRDEQVVAPLAGVRVLDLTRVIAGPVCTRFLAAYGAQVLRIDPPFFAEVPAIIPEVTPGKRCASLDLRSSADRQRFTDLVAQADVLVGGLRDG